MIITSIISFPTLKDLGASEPEISKLVLWFRNAASEWEFSTMEEFAKYARARLRIKLGQQKTNLRSLAMRIIDALFGDEDYVTLRASDRSRRYASANPAVAIQNPNEWRY